LISKGIWFSIFLSEEKNLLVGEHASKPREGSFPIIQVYQRKEQ